MDMEKLFALAKEVGFTNAAEMDTTKLSFLPEVRQMCEANRCGNYGKKWVCPPACGDLETLRERAHDFGKGVLVQTTAQLEDSFDIEGIEEASRRHSESMLKFTPLVRKMYSDIWPMPAGGCTLCETCAYPDAPCRHPDLAAPSMEACGLVVSKVCEACGIPYYYGPNTLTYVSCVLFK